MREIKFRGKRIDKDEWVYGYYVGDEEPRPIIHSESFSYMVIPETVGQYTGLKDKNGKEIYEGDILEYGLFSKFIGVVKYNNRNGGYCIESKDESNRVIWDSVTSRSEIIGNIHEHGHLLEEKAL